MSTPACVEARIPVTDARVQELDAWASSKRIPSAAIRSKNGVVSSP
jgi:hypothetical protein